MKDYIEFLKTLHDCSFISDDGYAKVMEDPRFQGWLKQEKKKTPSAEERQGEYDSSKCQARIWADGYDQVQCSFLPHNGTCFCKRHSGSDWWLGKITDSKPEKPILYSKVHPEGLEHQWKNDSQHIEEATEHEKEEKGPKRRGRPKGSKNKKKKETGKKPDMSIEEIQALIKIKEQEEQQDQKKASHIILQFFM